MRMTADVTANRNGLTLCLPTNCTEPTNKVGCGPSMAPRQGEDMIFEGRRVLVVDDNALARRVTVALLEELGCCCTVVGSGLEAIEAFSSTRFDVILMESGMDGLQAAKAIRQMEGTSERTPIIALSASGSRERCLRAGMDARLRKPATLASIRETISLFLPTPEVEGQ